MKKSSRLRVPWIIACAIPLLLTAGAKKTTHAVSIEDMKFNPDKLEITVGDSVEWTNNDQRDHNVTAKDGSFKSDNLGSGEKFKFTFSKAGKFAYACSLHPRMKGTILVSPP